MCSKALVVLLLALGCAPRDAPEAKGEADGCDDDDSAAGVGSTWYRDADADGYGDPGASVDACAQPDGFVETDLDCDDMDASVYPGAPDPWYDGVDSDCVGDDDYDQDGDGYVPDEHLGRATAGVEGSGASPGGDCADADPLVHPGAEEVCDGIDNNCDGGIDDDVDATTWYADADGDGYGDPAETTDACVQPENFVDNSNDCDDTNALVNPGVSEDCSTAWDDNCSGSTNELDAVGCTDFFYDGDEDGAGIAETACHCEAEGYYSADNAADCEDRDAGVNPGETDTWYDGIDTDCDGRDDYDQDEDGYVPTLHVGLATTYVSGSGGLPGNDCDDTDAAINPTAAEVWHDGIDQDCDGGSDHDADLDGQDSDDWGGTDCDDTNAAVYSGATETCATDYDDDCDGDNNDRDAEECVDFTYDADGDGFGTTSSRCTCEPSGDWRASTDDDCDDSNEDTYPGASDAWYDGVDSDCDGKDDYDADEDGYVRTIDVGEATPGVPGSGDLPGNDCDDTRAAVNPAAIEACATSYDDDCDGDANDVEAIGCVDFNEDVDGDGYGSASTQCTCEEDGFFRADNDEDCDDTDALVNPDAEEICDDGFDNTCDGLTDLDDTDCASTHPGGGAMIRILASSFDMGCTPGQSDCNTDESPVMPVTLTNDYYIGETEVTQGEFLAVMGYNPSSFSSCGSSCPVESLTWYEAAAFANAMSDAAGLTQCYACTGSGSSVECSVAMDPYTCDGYRLPTEAEWEGAARCGEDLLYAGSDDIDRVAWYWDVSGSTTHPVAELDPNACGLYDMSGNVWEWTQDWSDSGYYTSSGRTDPTGASRGIHRVDRGGSWYYAARFSRVAYRSSFSPGDRFYGLGVRVSRTVEP